jgi:short-subunit dehydrogenase
MARRKLAERRILITGASQGVGSELAKACARLHMHLILVARNRERLELLQPELSTAGAASVVHSAGDIAEKEFREKLLQQLAVKWSALDILVNNAGISAHGDFSDGSEATLRRIMEVNFFAATELTRELLQLLRKGNDPAIVNIGSVLGLRGIPYNSEYCASKFALRGWTEALRVELGREGVDVLLVSPGTIETNFFDHLIAKSKRMPWGKQKGIAPQQVARQIIRALERRQTEIFPNWRGRLLVTANRLIPGVVDRVMRKLG